MGSSSVLVIDPCSCAVARLEMLYGDMVAAVGTGFLWDKGDQSLLFTAWHNLTGTNPMTGQPISKGTGMRPNRLAAYFMSSVVTQMIRVSVGLYTAQGAAQWLVHPEYGRNVDIAALPLAKGLLKNAYTRPINEIANTPIQMMVGSSATIVGFPRGLDAGGTPIWKNGSIATEPDLAFGRNHFLIDAATREGLSGAPVILRREGGYSTVDGYIASPGVFYRLVGLYSGRTASVDQLEAQLGIVWPAHLIHDIVALGVGDSFELHG